MLLFFFSLRGNELGEGYEIQLTIYQKREGEDVSRQIHLIISDCFHQMSELEFSTANGSVFVRFKNCNLCNKFINKTRKTK